MADEKITSADTQEGAQQQATDAQLLDDLTSLQQATEGMDEAQADGQVATNNEGDADNPSMTRPDDEFKDQRGLPEGGTTDTFALDNTDLQNSNEQSNTTDLQFTAQNTTQDATVLNLDNVRIDLEGAEGERSSSDSTRGSTSASPTAAAVSPADAPPTSTDPAPTPSPALAAPTTTPSPTTPQPTPADPTSGTPPSGSTDSGGNNNSGTSTIVTRELSVYKSAVVTLDAAGTDDGDRTTDGDSVAGQFIDSADDEITYTIVLDNTGNQNLSSLVITDAKLSADTDYELVLGSYNGTSFIPATSGGSPITITSGTLTNGQLNLGSLVLAPDQALQLVFTYVVSAEDIAGKNNFVNTVLVDSDLTEASDPANEDGTDDAEPKDGVSYATTPIRTPELALTKTADVTTESADDFAFDGKTDDTVDSAGDVITYTIKVDNTGNVNLTNVQVYDSMFLKTAEQGLGTIKLYASLEDANAGTGGVELSADVATGKVTLAATTGAPLTSLAANTDYFIRYTYNVQTSDITSKGNEIDSTLLTRIDTPYAIDNVAKGYSDQIESAITYDTVDIRTPELALTKTADVTTESADDFAFDGKTDDTVDSAGDVITYTIKVDNTGNVNLTNVQVYDSMFLKTAEQGLGTIKLYASLEDANAGTGGVELSADVATGKVTLAATTGAPLTSLAANTDYFIRYTYNVQTSDITSKGNEIDSTLLTRIDTPYAIDNVAKGYSDQIESAITYDTVDIRTPELALTKTADVTTESADDFAFDGKTDDTVDSAGDVITYTIKVDNTGNVNLTNVQVYDSMFLKTAEQGLGTIKLYASLEDANAGTGGVELSADVATGKVTLAATTGAPLTSLAANTDYFIRYTYNVQTSDITSKGNEIDSTLLTRIDTPYAIDNVAKGYSDQIESAITYDTVDIRTPELTLAKTAMVTTEGLDYGLSGVGSIDDVTTLNINEAKAGFVDSGEDVITYTLMVKNTGSTSLTNVIVSDSMFSKTSGLGAIKLYASLADADAGTNVLDTLTPTGGSVTMPMTVAAGADYFIRYTYTVQASDITSNIIGENADFDIDNSAYASDGDVVSDIVSYAVNIRAYSDIAIYKEAVVTRTPEEITNGITPEEITAGTVGTDITYTLQVLNEGTTELTGIRVYDQMFRKSYSDSDLSSDEQQLYVKVYGANGVEIENRSFDATVEFDQVTNDYFISFGDNSLNAGEYATISYGYVVSLEDFGTPANDTQSLFNYIQNMGPQGDPGDAIEMGYGTFTAYVNKVSNETYDVVADRLVDPDNVYNEAATVFANRDNTGFAIGVNAGVMAGDRNGNQDHLLMQFNPSNFRDDKQSLVEGVSIVFTNATTVELGFKAIYGNNQEFVGSLTIGAQGNQLTYNLKEVVDSQLLTVKGQSVMGYVFENSDPIPTSTPYVFKNELGEMYSLSVSPGPGGAQNLLYTLTFNPADSELGNVSSFDFWVVGDLGGNNQEQIKVVDVQFDVVDYGTSDLTNIAKVISDQDNLLVSTDGGSDEVATVTIGLLSGLSAQDALIAQELGYSVESIKDDYSKILEFKNKGLSLSELVHISVNKDSNISDGVILSTLGIDENKVSINPPVLTAAAQSVQLVEAGDGVTGVSTATIQMTASDPDGTTPSYDTTGWSRVGTTAVYTQVGTYGTASLDTSKGLVTYALDNSKVVTQALDASEPARDTFAVKVGDGLSSTTTNAVFSITGSNDAPILTAATQSRTLIEVGDGVTGVSTATIQMTASDPDGTTPSYDTTGWSRVGTTAVYTQAGTYGTASLDTSTGLVTYTLDNSRVATEALTGNESASDTFAVKVGDGLSSTTTNAVFSITGSNDIDTIAPYIISSTPADGSTGVSSGYSVRIITFNENIARGTSGTISLIGSKSSATASFDIVNDFVSNNRAPANGKFSIIGDTLYIGASLQANVDYYLYVTTGALKDLSGNNLVLTNQSLNFTTPITFDLNNDGIEYLSTSAGVTYDYNGDGVAESTAWVSPEDGLLALSQEDGSLKIVFSTQDGETDLEGLAKIYDSNQDGQLDELDTFFNQFGVWQDADSDGVVDSGEFQLLTDRNIVSLDLVSDGIERTEANGDVFVYGQTTYTKADGTTGLADDAAFVVRSSDEVTTNTIQIGNTGEVVYVPDFGTNDQIDLSTILANAAITRDNLKDYVQLVDGENGTVLNIDTTGHGGEGGWVQVASLDNVHVGQAGVNMFFDPTNQTIDFTQSGPDEWKVEDGDTPV